MKGEHKLQRNNIILGNSKLGFLPGMAVPAGVAVAIAVATKASSLDS